MKVLNEEEIRTEKSFDSIESKKKLAFICVHNSCRSQIAEALAKKNISHKFEIYSAGTDISFICVHNSCRSQIAEALEKKIFRINLKYIQLELIFQKDLIKMR